MINTPKANGRLLRLLEGSQAGVLPWPPPLPALTAIGDQHSSERRAWAKEFPHDTTSDTLYSVSLMTLVLWRRALDAGGDGAAESELHDKVLARLMASLG